MNINAISVVANIIFTWDSFLIPVSRPRQTLISPIKVITAIIITWFEKVSLIEKTWAKPELIYTVPKPSEVVTPKTVVKIAIISINIAKGLFFETLEPNKELTLNGNFLLYEANAKHNPRDE